MCAHNITSSEVTKNKPFAVLYGQKPRLPMDNTLQIPGPDGEELMEEFAEERNMQMKNMFDLMSAELDAGQQRQLKNTMRLVEISVLNEEIWSRLRIFCERRAK